jgi:hypothetical protein
MALISVRCILSIWLSGSIIITYQLSAIERMADGKLGAIIS